MTTGAHPAGSQAAATRSSGVAGRLSGWLDEPRMVALVAVAYLPFIFGDYGTDLDVLNVRRAGEAILDGGYEPSRLPGAPVFEAAAGLLDAVGGSVATNLGSLVLALALAVSLRRLLVRGGVEHPELVCLVFMANPFTWIAGTSTADFTWALALLVLGVERHLAGRPWVAAVAFAGAAGCRLSTALVVGAFLLVDAAASPERRRPVLTTLAAAGGLTAVIYVPPFLWADASFGFLQADNPPRGSLMVQLGRAGVKALYLPGLVGAGLLLAALPAVARDVSRRWRSSSVLRFALVTMATTAALFVVFPWKFGHLLPAWLGVLVLVGLTRLATSTFLTALLAAQLLHAVVSLWFLVPDVPGAAGGARFDVRVGVGVLVNDVACRTEETTPGLDEATQDAIEDRFECMLEPFQGER